MVYILNVYHQQSLLPSCDSAYKSPHQCDTDNTYKSPHRCDVKSAYKFVSSAYIFLTPVVVTIDLLLEPTDTQR